MSSGPGKKPVNAAEIRERFRKLKVWQRGDQRAPHKPLLLLLALARCLRLQQPQINFVEIEDDLLRLLKDFGPARRSYHPEFPFWHLQTGGFWEMTRRLEIAPRTGNNNPSAAELRRKNASAGFTEDVWKTLKSDHQLVFDLAHDLLEEHFPSSIHGDILSAVGLEEAEDEYVSRRSKKRDLEFRRRVMLIYNYMCAVCGLDIRMENSPVGIEAAHIKWHQAHGPSVHFISPHKKYALKDLLAQVKEPGQEVSWGKPEGEEVW